MKRNTHIVVALVILGTSATPFAACSRRGADRPAQVAQTRKADTSGTEGMAGMPGMSGVNTDSSAAGSVSITPEQITQFGITFGTAAVRTLHDDTRAVGVVTVDETRLTQVVPRVSGFVERLYVNATGQRVRRGEPLLDVYAPDLVAAQRELLLAAQLDHQIGQAPVPGMTGKPGDLVEAAKQRLRLWQISDAQIDSVLRTGEARQVLTLYAPSDGVVLERNVVQGQALVPGADLYTIADLSTVWIDVRVREMDAAAVRAGSDAMIDITGLPGRRLVGHVAYVYPTLDSTARAIRARVSVPNPGEALKPGMYAEVRLATPARSVLTVPTDAVLRGGDRNVVFVDMGTGRLMPHTVELGHLTDAYAEILSGVESGQRVVTSAQYLLDSESNLAEVMKSMISQMNTSDVGRAPNANDMPDMPGMSAPSKGAKPPAKTPAPKR